MFGIKICHGPALEIFTWPVDDVVTLRRYDGRRIRRFTIGFNVYNRRSRDVGRPWNRRYRRPVISYIAPRDSFVVLNFHSKTDNARLRERQKYRIH